MRLEIGCGTADNSFPQLRKWAFRPKITGDDVIYLDVGNPEVQIANYVRGDVQTLPFKSESFKEIYGSHVIEHVKNPTLALKEAKRVLKSKGTLHIWCPNKFSEGVHDPTHLWFFTYRSLHRALTAQGFQSAVHGNGFGLFQKGVFLKIFTYFFSRELEAVGWKR